MISNLSSTNKCLLQIDKSLPFSEYIHLMRAKIEEGRNASEQEIPLQQVLEANSPYELYPPNPIRGKNRLKYGVLLIHGLLDCPFSLKDIGLQLQKNGMLCRAILLPGHGTTPNDLCQASYHDWIEIVRYGINTLEQDVDEIFIIGYSTGAALALYQALQNPNVSGIILLSPAIKVKAPVDLYVGWRYMMQMINKNKEWVFRDKEIDYAKFISVPFNAIKQISNLTKAVQELTQQHALSKPLFMAMSYEDETICSQSAIDYFKKLSNPLNKLLLYTADHKAFADHRIMTRPGSYPDLQIKHLSHVSIPFSPANIHYGNQGDYVRASLTNKNSVIYGAYNRLEEKAYRLLYKTGLIKKKRCELTYNPDFEYMAEQITEFILHSSANKTTS